MPKRTRSYSSWRLEKLTDPDIAAHYLNAAKNDSSEMFLKALGNVIQAHQVASVAKKAGVQRESLYRSFSGKGNPTWDTFRSVLNALEIEFEFSAKGSTSSLSHGGKRKKRFSTLSKIAHSDQLRDIGASGQLSLFPEIANLAADAVSVASQFVRPIPERYKSVPAFANPQDVTIPPYIANFQNITVGTVQVLQ
jgi:probable addiction module antidote protein